MWFTQKNAPILVLLFRYRVAVITRVRFILVMNKTADCYLFNVFYVNAYYYICVSLKTAIRNICHYGSLSQISYRIWNLMTS